MTRWVVAAAVAAAALQLLAAAVGPWGGTLIRVGLIVSVLGAYLEAVCIEGVDAVADVLDGLRAQVTFVSLLAPAVATTGAPRPAASLLSHVDGPTVLVSLLSEVTAVESLTEALAMRERLRPGESVITRNGVWIGRHWLRVSRDANAHEGVLEREQELARLRPEIAMWTTPAAAARPITAKPAYLVTPFQASTTGEIRGLSGRLP